MGNRAHVIFTDGEKISPAVYLHWNGGPESIYQFLDELDRRNVRADCEYEAARFIAIVCEFFDKDYYGACSVGVSNGPTFKKITPSTISSYDHGDNGVFVVNRSGEIRVVRRFTCGEEWPPCRVEKERDSAYKHKYAMDNSIRSVFGKKPTEAEATISSE